MAKAGLVMMDTRDGLYAMNAQVDFPMCKQPKWISQYMTCSPDGFRCKEHLRNCKPLL